MTPSPRALDPLLLAVAALGAAPPGDPGPPEAARPQELIVDNPTFRHLAFRWPVRGDEDGDASLEVAYREAGTEDWRPALPFKRVGERQGVKLVAGSAVLTIPPGESGPLLSGLRGVDYVHLEGLTLRGSWIRGGSTTGCSTPGGTSRAR